MRIGIVEPSDFSTEAMEVLLTLGQVERFDGCDLTGFLLDKTVIFIRLGHYIDLGFLEKCPQLRVICTPTTGLTHLDLAEVEKRQIKVISLKGEYAYLETIRATSEHVVGLAIALLRNYRVAFRGSGFEPWNREALKGFELFRNSVGLIGYGRIGKQLAKYFQSFETSVYTYDIDKGISIDTQTIWCDSLDELIQKSEIIVLSASYSPSQYRCFSKDFFDRMDGKYFINISRGEFLDEDVLLDVIESNRLKGIALDVIANEQMEESILKFDRYLKSRNLILTPHIGGATYTSMQRTELFIANKLAAGSTH